MESFSNNIPIFHFVYFLLGGTFIFLIDLLETFNIRWDVHRDVAKELLRFPPETQWQVISVKVPRHVHNPNGFVISRIVKANNRFRFSSASHGCSVGPADLCPEAPSSNTAHENRDSPCILRLS